MPDCADSAHLSSDERLRDVAAILAAGVLRIRQHAAFPTVRSPENLAKPPPEGLELPANTRLSVRVG